MVFRPDKPLVKFLVTKSLFYRWKSVRVLCIFGIRGDVSEVMGVIKLLVNIVIKEGRLQEVQFLLYTESFPSSGLWELTLQSTTCTDSDGVGLSVGVGFGVGVHMDNLTKIDVHSFMD